MQSSITANHSIQRHPEHIACQLDEEEVVMNCHTGSYFQLNNLGGYIWTLIETPQSLSTLVEILQTEYNADRTTIQKETLDFLESLHQKRLILLS